MPLLPGLILSFLLASLAFITSALPFWPFTIEGAAPHPIDPMVLALIFGMAARQFSPSASSFQPGLAVAIKKLLPLAIILMGARMDFSLMTRLSLPVLAINAFCVTTTFFLTLKLCQWWKISEKMALLLAIGTAVCGSTAIAAAAPVIGAEKRETALSITTITLFGILAIFLYPLIGHFLSLDEIAFGVWVGTAIQAVPQVIGAGFSYSPLAGEIGLLVKLARVLFLVPMILYLSLSQKKESPSSQKYSSLVPPFLYGFLLFATLSSLGCLPHALKTLMQTSSSWMMVTAMVAVGFDSEWKGALNVHAPVLLCGFLSATLLGGVSYILISFFSFT